jgi:glutamate-1-semialdehyde 2,1-aminomutase
VVPDLATFGKAIGGGIVLSAFAGRREVMEMMLSGAAYGGTFNGNPIAMAAAKVTLDILAENNGAALAHANHIGSMLRKGLEEEAAECGIPVMTTGFGAAFSVHFTKRRPLRRYRDTLEDDKALLARFLRDMLDEGIFLLPDGRIYTSVVHSEREVDETVEAARKVFRKLS